MERALNDIRMETPTMAHSRMVKHMGKEYTHGAMEKSTMANGIKDLNMGMVFGEVYITILTLVNGDHLKLKAMECISGRMEIGTKGNGNSA
jgi:hypothetical protein